MAATPVANGKTASRPQTPRASTPVKAIRYEEASTGTPPLPITTAAQHRPPSPKVPTQQSPIARPQTAPSRGTHRSSLFTEDVKRDSGFASSPLRQRDDAASTDVPPTPSLPTYVTKEERAKVRRESAVLEKRKSSRHENKEEARPRTSFGRRRSKKRMSNKPRSASPPTIRRLESFKGIETDIPTGDLSELTTDNLGFSNRGSIMFGGKKMNELFAAISAGDDTYLTSKQSQREAEQSSDSAWPLRQEKKQHDTSWPLQQQADQSGAAWPLQEEQSVLDSPRISQQDPDIVARGRILQQEQLSSGQDDTLQQDQSVLGAVDASQQRQSGGLSAVSESRQDRPVTAAPVQSAAETGQADPTAVHDSANGEGPAATIPTIQLPDGSSVQAAEQDSQTLQQATEAEPLRKGLVAGRRKPSVHMLQAAIAGGRVLSAEEITFSMKVRSMYDAGDEDAADWTKASNTNGKDTPEVDDAQDQVGELAIGKTRGHNKTASKRQSQDIRASYYTKSPSELAGGIEDWQDVRGEDVDRYGFIVPRVPGDRPASVGVEGLHRVATGLRLAADQPRRRGLRRMPSNARSSRSLPPQSSLRPSSLHSSTSAAASTRSRRSIFRRKDRRIMDAAGDMLTLPPGLADISEDQTDGQVNALKRREWSRNEKWQKMARPVGNSLKTGGAGMQFAFDMTDPKLISRTWKGIPDRWRATAWHSFLSASARRRGKHDSDETLIEEFHRVQSLNCADDYQIDVDVPRTINMHVMFRRRYRGGQRLLFRVLHAIALHFPDTGYVQGMASLAATLLCYFDEERAFVMLVRLWQLRGLEQLFKTGFEGLMAALRELENNWLAGSGVAAKLHELSISSTAYGTRWYLTLFNMSIPFPAQLRVWDVFMLLGDATPKGSGLFGGADIDVLHATSAALIDATREIILDSDFENAMKVLTSFVPIRDEDMLMRVTHAEWKAAKRRTGYAVG